MLLSWPEAWHRISGDQRGTVDMVPSCQGPPPGPQGPDETQPGQGHRPPAAGPPPGHWASSSLEQRWAPSPARGPRRDWAPVGFLEWHQTDQRWAGPRPSRQPTCRSETAAWVRGRKKTPCRCSPGSGQLRVTGRGRGDFTVTEPRGTGGSLRPTSPLVHTQAPRGFTCSLMTGHPDPRVQGRCGQRQ